MKSLAYGGLIVLLIHQITTPILNPKSATGAASAQLVKASPTPVRPVALTKDQVYAKINPLTVTIQVGREIGSGSIHSDRVVTCDHVIKRIGEGGHSTIRLSDGRELAATVIKRDRANDLALLKLDSPQPLPGIELAESVKSGEKVYAIGSPYGKPGVMTDGNVLRKNEVGDIVSNALVKPGNSGGPLINQFGKLVATNCGVDNSKDGTETISKPLPLIRAMLGGGS